LKLEKSVTTSIGSNFDSFQKEIEDLIENTSEVEPAIKKSSPKTSDGPWEILGLRALKIKNNDEEMPNLLVKIPSGNILVEHI
jgi:hypothetical protein